MSKLSYLKILSYIIIYITEKKTKVNFLWDLYKISNYEKKKLVKIIHRSVAVCYTKDKDYKYDYIPEKYAYKAGI